MARALRLEWAGAWYHVTARGNEQRAIFRDRRDRQHFLELVAEATERFRFEVHAYVLMDNHYHLLVHTLLPNLSASQHWLGVSYSLWFNRRHQRVGHLFQGRFKAIVVEAQAWGLALSRYVHLNPVRNRRPGLDQEQRPARQPVLAAPPRREEIQQRLQRLRAYPWSSYRAYVGLAATPSWLVVQTVLNWIGGRSGAQQQQAYQHYVEGAIRQGLAESPWAEVVGQVVLGGKQFLQRLRRRLRGNSQEQPSLRALAQRPHWEQIVRAVEQVKRESWSRFRDRHGDWGRDLVLYLGQRYGGCKLQFLAQAAGGVDYRSAQKAVARFAARLKREEALARVVQRAVQQISNVV